MRHMSVDVQPKEGEDVVRVVLSYDDTCVGVEHLCLTEALSLAREFSLAAAQLTAFAAERLE